MGPKWNLFSELVQLLGEYLSDLEGEYLSDLISEFEKRCIKISEEY